MSFRLLLPAPILQAILDQARAELPNECCGLLAGIAPPRPRVTSPHRKPKRFFILMPPLPRPWRGNLSQVSIVPHPRGTMLLSRNRISLNVLWTRYRASCHFPHPHPPVGPACRATPRLPKKFRPRPLQVRLGKPNLPVALVTKHYPLVNEAASPVEFWAEPRSQLAAHKDMDREGLELLGVYHSHPTAPPLPSRKDRERSLSDTIMSLIVSLETDPPTIGAWWLTAESHRVAEWDVMSAPG